MTWICSHLDWLVLACMTVVVASHWRTSGNVVIALAIDATPYFALVTACCLVFGVITSDMPLTLVSAAVAICQRARDAASLSSEVFPRHPQSAPMVMIPDR